MNFILLTNLLHNFLYYYRYKNPSFPSFPIFPIIDTGNRILNTLALLDLKYIYSKNFIIFIIFITCHQEVYII